MRKRKDCSCRGLNENCYKCFGRGYYYDSEDEPLHDFKGLSQGPIITKSLFSYNLKDRNQTSQAKKAGSELVQCPHCPSKVRKDNLKWHIERVHRIEQQKREFKEDGAPKGLVACPYCKFIFEKDQLKAHISLMHPMAVRRPVAKPAPNEKKKPRGRRNNSESKKSTLILCPYCKILIGSGGQRDHKCEALKKNSKSAEKSQPSKGQSRVAQPAAEKIDGSKGWHAFRDTGRFGSHPIFDPMDDDSSP